MCKCNQTGKIYKLAFSSLTTEDESSDTQSDLAEGQATGTWKEVV